MRVNATVEVPDPFFQVNEILRIDGGHTVWVWRIEATAHMNGFEHYYYLVVQDSPILLPGTVLVERQTSPGQPFRAGRVPSNMRRKAHVQPLDSEGLQAYMRQLQA